jgi:signal transduction histidine kinase/CheY-like chemotaxis protein
MTFQEPALGWLGRRGWGYVAGVGGVLLAAGLKLALGSIIDANSFLLLLLGAVTGAAWLGGARPGLATTLLGALAGSIVVMPTGFAIPPADPAGAISLGLFLLQGGLISLVVESLRRATSRGIVGQRPSSTRSDDNDDAKVTKGGVERRKEVATFDQLGLTLSGQLDMASLAKAVTDAGVALTGAAFGAFLYQDGSGGPTHYVTGAPPEAFVDFPLSQEPGTFGSPFRGAVSRSDDLYTDSRFAQNLPFKQMPSGHVSARSYLAAPVHSATGVFRGGLFFGHPDPGVFQETDERLVANLAAHAAIAADNAHLFREAQEARVAAEAANNVKDAFLATLSHELRTPLTSIVGWANLLKLGRLPVDETSRAIDTILRNATSQSQIIDELLDVSRIITGKLHLDLRVIEVGVIVKAAVETVTPAANAKGIRLQFIQDPAGSWVMGDPDRLQQVFWNLLFNAIKFTPKNGRVRVSVQSIGSNVEVVVEDTGLGIDAEFLPRIFERFTQSDSSSTRAVRGLGLGLSIARQLAELHGGTIRAESPGIGHGSTFTVIFPRSPVAATPSSERVYTKADATVGLEDAPDLSGIQVLVVEDDDDARALVEKVLTGQGASVKSVSKASAALEILAQERVDVLLSDIEMPGTDGYQLIRELRLRSSQQGGAVPALALSAYARTEDRLRALRAGFQLHLAKPVQPSELVTVVASLAGRRS